MRKIQHQNTDRRVLQSLPEEPITCIIRYGLASAEQYRELSALYAVIPGSKMEEL